MGSSKHPEKQRSAGADDDDADATDRSGSVDSALSNFHDTGKNCSVVSQGDTGQTDVAMCTATSASPGASLQHARSRSQMDCTTTIP